MNKEINIITLGDIFENIETEEKAFKFLNYIVNLQKENKQLKERFERLKQEHIDTITRNEEKQQRIDKAIEYIGNYEEYCDEENCYCTPKYFEYLLKILGDKENE